MLGHTYVRRLTFLAGEKWKVFNVEDLGFYMEPGVIGAYIVFLCWSAIRSEPETYCYKKDKAGAYTKTILGFALGLTSTALAALSTGSDSFTQVWSVVESEDDDDVPYGYGFFHLVFATGSMYFGMLFLGWETHHTTGKWNLDAGWASTWVHIANEGLVILSFVAIQIARIYEIGWLRKGLAWIFGTGGGEQQQLLQRGDESHQSTEFVTAPASPLSQQSIPNEFETAPASPLSQQSTEVSDPPPSSPPLSDRTEVYLSD